MKTLTLILVGGLLVFAARPYLDRNHPVPPEPTHIIHVPLPIGETPPQRIQRTVRLMDAGYDVSFRQMNELSRWIEENPVSWNLWCQRRR